MKRSRKAGEGVGGSGQFLSGGAANLPPAPARLAGLAKVPSSVPGRPRIGLGVTTLGRGGGGVAVVGRLLRDALADLCRAAPEVIELTSPEQRPSAVRQASFFARLLKSQAAGSSDFWMFNHLGPARAQLRIPRRFRRPYGVFIHGIEAWDPELGADRRRVLEEAAVRIANSAYTAGRVAAAHPDLGEIGVCPLALPVDSPDQGAPDAEVLEAVGPGAVLIVGRMDSRERYKGHDPLLVAWPRVLAAVPNARLAVVGGGDDLERLRGRAAALGLGDRVVFTGFVDDATLAALFARAAMLAMPSRGEGFGLVYLEAMRAGVPSIASIHDAAGEVVRHGVTGSLVDADDTEALAGAIATLLQDEGMRRRMGAAGRRDLETRFTFAAFRDRLGDILADALSPAFFVEERACAG